MSTQPDIDDETTADVETTGQTDDYAVPATEDPLVCQYCGTPFAAESYMALHWGQRHGDALTDEEQQAYEEAADEEHEELKLFRLKAVGLLVLLYFGLLMTYAVFA